MKHEKRLTITLSDSVFKNLEDMAKELGLSKSGMISVALENYKKGQVNKKKPSWQAGLLNVLCLDIVYFMAKEKQDFYFLLYPDGEGFPSDWEIRLELIGQPIAISPLHDQDKDKKNGGYKKRHYHGIYVANNPVTADSVRVRIQRALSSEVEECKAIARVQIVRTSIENVYLYLTHESKDAVVKKKNIAMIKRILSI